MTDAELSLLSLLVEGPRYGSEISQIVEERDLRAWLTIGFSSIYTLLNRLEQQQLIEAEMAFEGRGPARKRYTLTAAGHGILQTAVADLLRQPPALGSGFELGLVNLHVLSPQAVYRLLSNRLADLQNQLSGAKEAWADYQQSGKDADHLRALYTHTIALTQAETEWLIAFLEGWRERYPAAASAPTKRQTGINPAATTQISKPRQTGTLGMIQRLDPPED